MESTGRLINNEKHSSKFKINISFYTVYWLGLMFLSQCNASATYSTVTGLFDDLLGDTSGYNHAVRPLLDQTRPVEVNVSFDIIAIVEVDAVQQKLVINGFMGLSWKDELLTWTPSDYGNTALIHPYPSQVWRPRLVLSNTLEDRDLFRDDYCPLTILHDGSTSWLPGSLFPSSCKLDLYKYPFDVQTCNLDMFTMGLMNSEMLFAAPSGTVGTSFYVENGEWKIESTKITTSSGNFGYAFFIIEFKLRRLPGFFIINIVCPIVLLSFLNIMVFLIPVDSGEKIGYGITVLLALSVFLSIVSSELPRSSNTLPLVTIYLLVLTIISVCTVIVCIAIVCFHHMDEKEAKRQKATSNFKGFFNKIRSMNRAAASITRVKPENQKASSIAPIICESDDNLHPDKSIPDKTETVLNIMNKLKMNTANGLSNHQHTSSDNKRTLIDVGGGGGGGGGDGSGGDGDGVSVNRWKQIGKHIDFVSFVIFTVIWVSVTIGFLGAMSS